MALFFPHYSTWTGTPALYLEDLFVIPEARGTGAGFALMQALAEIAETSVVGSASTSPSSTGIRPVGSISNSAWSTSPNGCSIGSTKTGSRGWPERVEMAELKVYGAPWCPDCRRSKAFLSEHRISYDWIDIDQDADALAYVEELQNGGRSIPTVILPDGGMLIEPSDEELAQALGIQVRPLRQFYDLAVVGGGPAGLAASIYAAREGIDTVVIERSALGGQAGLTNRIDNYPGFPDGVDGDDLMSRFVAQARALRRRTLVGGRCGGTDGSHSM